MATAQFAQRGPTPTLFKSEWDMNTFFDFGDGVSPRPAPTPVQAGPSNQTGLSYQDDDDDRQVFAGPSHEYDRFPQQTGVVSGNVRNLAHTTQQMPDNFNFGGFNSGIDESSYGMWDMDSDMNMDMNMNNAVFNKFVDPSFIESEEPQSNVGRLWPGMHQQAAMAKAQQVTSPQPQPQPQQQQQTKTKGRVGQTADPHTEESISRLLNQMRHQTNLPSINEEDSPTQSNFLSRSKKDELDMDEDERLLASEEGKKLSSKERRQLRNKVSARAFRSRRKEYIGQLEGEVAVKAQESAGLKAENTALTEENARYRALIETLLRHPSFTPFIEDFSKDPAFIASQIGTSQSRSSSAAKPHQIKEQQQSQMPEGPVDLSMLNINNPNNASFQMHQQPQQQMAFDFSHPPMYPAQQYTQAPSQLDIAMDRSRGNSYF